VSTAWDDGDEDIGPAFCRCFCHGTVELLPDGGWRSFINCPPRLDNAMGWAESCDKCSVEHWIAAEVHNQVTALEADEREDANAYIAHYITKQGKK
jgi:hypothetical protein